MSEMYALFFLSQTNNNKNMSSSSKSWGKVETIQLGESFDKIEMLQLLRSWFERKLFNCDPLEYDYCTYIESSPEEQKKIKVEIASFMNYLGSSTIRKKFLVVDLRSISGSFHACGHMESANVYYVFCIDTVQYHASECEMFGCWQSRFAELCNWRVPDPTPPSNQKIDSSHPQYFFILQQILEKVEKLALRKYQKRERVSILQEIRDGKFSSGESMK